jgi:ketosteroid isomerase-like protein
MLAKANFPLWSSRVIAFGIALFFVLAGSGSSKAHSAASNGKLAAAQVLELQKRFEEATVTCDAATIAKLMADDAIFVHGNASVQRKPEFVKAARERRFRIKSFDITDPKVVFFDGGAIISGVENIVLGPSPAGGQPRKVRMRVSDVWVARPGGWQLILNQGTPFPSAQTQPAARDK